MIKNWLNKPYYFNPTLRYKLSVCVGFGFFIFLFVFIFEPFRMNNLKNDRFYYSLGYGFITFAVLIFTTVIAPFIFPKLFDNDKWILKKHLYYLLITVAFISCFNWYYNSIVQKGGELGILSFPRMIIYTLIIGFFPIIIYLFIDEKLSRSKRLKITKNLNNKINKRTKKNIQINVINIESDETKESISIDVNSIVYITSEKNYASFFIVNEKGNNLKEIVIRITLTSVLNQLNAYKNIVRCHKSYIINTNYIQSYSGNARGYSIKTNKTDFNIPVSRSFNKEKLESLISF